MPFTTVDSVRTTDDHELTLYRHQSDFYIYLDGNELMSSRTHGSESALAEWACRNLASARPRVLIGGLGLGFTVQAALEVLPATAEVVVAELFPAVVGWHRDHLASLGRPLDDPRTSLYEGDVWAAITEAKRHYDAILLDVDNGPSAFCVDSNRRLYSRHGIEMIREALTPEGTLAVWSTDRDPGFVARLRKAGLETRDEMARGHEGKGTRHIIILATQPRSPARSRSRR